MKFTKPPTISFHSYCPCCNKPLKPTQKQVIVHKSCVSVIVAVLMISSMSYVFAEEYDLSDHPVYNWTWNEDINFSNERYSNPKASNVYHLEALSQFIDPDFDPTHIYYEKRVSTFDYCDLKQFSKYPKCRV